MDLQYIPPSEFARIEGSIEDTRTRLQLISDMCRLNTLVAVKRAGSGHLGSSFSAIDIFVCLYWEVMNISPSSVDDPDRDIVFSSKGHDVPGLYSVLCARGILPEDKLLKLRRLGGLDGHPDISIRGIETNTGSLGMGISKAKGMAYAKKLTSRGGRVYVITGDGELQEGQIWESLQVAAHQNADITVIVDNNKLQTDMPVEEIVSVSDLEQKFRAFGCEVRRCDGHDHMELIGLLQQFPESSSGPRVIIADTVKGKGVAMMEEISEMATVKGKYIWHSGAPDDEAFSSGFAEILGRINQVLVGADFKPLDLTPAASEVRGKSMVSKHYVAEEFGEELVALAEVHDNIVVMDGDLAADCRLRSFADRFPQRFVENGIAEQDMVSTAGGLALQGMIPVVNSFASFLAARANEQIYNNACEHTKIIYAAHFAGFIPAGPGKSHQSVRDIGLLGGIPGMDVIQPCSGREARMCLRYLVEESGSSGVIRMNIGPSPREIILPEDYVLRPGCGVPLLEGGETVVFAYGPVMLHEVLTAAEICSTRGVSITVINMPWLNRFDERWLKQVLAGKQLLITVDDHLVQGGIGDRLTAFLDEARVERPGRTVRMGLRELPVCGTPAEVLKHHSLDGASIAAQILDLLGQDGEAVTTDDIVVFDTNEAAQ